MLNAAPELLRAAPVEEEFLELPEAPEGGAIGWDSAFTGLTLRRHPMALLRARLAQHRFLSSNECMRPGNTY